MLLYANENSITDMTLKCETCCRTVPDDIAAHHDLKFGDPCPFCLS